MKNFTEIKKKLAFGLMRLPMIGEEVDIEQTKKMVDIFVDNGFNYFDTAHGYINGKSELAFKEAVSKRYPRDNYLITNKLTDVYFKTKKEIRPLFYSQLEACGVEYFDFYLMHAQNSRNFVHFKNCNAYETAFELKKEGKIKHVGISFHDTHDVLDQILTEYPELEVVQIQLNYLDYDAANIESRLCYEVCVKHDKPVLVMEPVKGGSLVNLPEEAQKILDSLNGGSNASYAIRFAASHENVVMVLSGMSTLDQMKDNVNTMKNFVSFKDEEYKAVFKVSEIIREKNMIACTKCSYCVAGCPNSISIPNIFELLNSKRVYNDWSTYRKYNELTSEVGKASSCVECGQCENICPQGLNITQLLKIAANTFEK